MKRNFELTNIEIVLPSKKRIKIKKLSIKLRKRMSTSEFEDEIDQLRPQKYPPNQEETNDHLTFDSETETLSSNDQQQINDDVMSQVSESVIEISDEEQTDVESVNSEPIRTPRSEDKYDKQAEELSQMNKWKKGEKQEEYIKDQLETYGFIVTKTQSKIDQRIIGDNGIDHLFQIKINNQIIRGIIQSKCWKNEIDGGVIRDLQGVLANQYPNRIGILVINNGGINQRAKNLVKNSNNTVLVYNFNELRYLKRDLKKLLREKKLQIQYQQIEKFEDGKVTESGIGPNRKTTITYRKLYRYTSY